MSVSKNKIIKNIAKDSLISNEHSSILLESFLKFIKKAAKSNTIKLSGFGVFSYKNSPQRLGRNPKTKDSYIIPKMNKLNFKPSNVVKDKIN
jgi:integration host factor subunit alpha